jgi:hypothetical protein
MMIGVQAKSFGRPPFLVGCDNHFGAAKSGARATGGNDVARASCPEPVSGGGYGRDARATGGE